MRKSRLILGFLIAMTLLGTTAFANTVSFDFSSLGTANVLFTGHATPGTGSFTFEPNAPGTYDLVVTGGDPAVAGFQGNILGDFSIGTIFTFGTMSVASVSGTGTFLISDGTYDLTATLEWIDIFQDGTGGSMNTSGTVNLSNFSYSGTNSALLSMLQNGNGSVVTSFTFNPALSLAILAETEGQHLTAFSGSVTSASVPETNSLVLLGSGLLSLAFAVRARLK